MGFWVQKVTIDKNPDEIDCLIVTAGETRVVNLTPSLPSPDVRFPVERPQIGKVVGPSV